MAKICEIAKFNLAKINPIKVINGPELIRKKLFSLFPEISRRKKGVKIAHFWLIFA